MSSSDFSLDNFRLPPGITLTRVQGSPTGSHHPELPMRMVSNHKDVSTNPIIVTSPLSTPKTKEPRGMKHLVLTVSGTRVIVPNLN